MLEHALDVAAAASLAPVVVVLGDAAPEIESAVRWRAEIRIRNPDPGRGVASSVRLGLKAIAAVEPPIDAVVVLLGDQPRVRLEVIRRLIQRSRPGDRPIVVPRYAEDAGRNPVLLARAAFSLAAALDGDRGFGPLIAAHPELVAEVEVAGSNPDVDTPADLAQLL